jgi:hypothetical protein
VRAESDDVRPVYVEDGETGFEELIESAELIFSYKGNAERLCVAIGKPSDLGEFTGFGMEAGIGDNGLVYIEESDGNSELLRWAPWSPTSTFELEKLNRGIELRARERSHFITMALAVTWTTLSVAIVI